MSFCFVFNWRDCTVKTSSARKLGQLPICHIPSAIATWEYFRQFLTRLVQNLTLRNNCNLIPSAHGTQQVVLSKRSLDYHQVVEFTLSCNVSFTQNFLSGKDFTLPTFSIMQSFIFDVVFPKSCESFRN